VTSPIELNSLISSISLLISISALLILHKNRVEMSRPIVTVLLESDVGNISTPLTLRVYNTGVTPALNIRIYANKEDIFNALDKKEDNKYKDIIYTCLSKENIIPVLQNGANVYNAFGLLSNNKI